jgi:hypothetical protein
MIEYLSDAHRQLLLVFVTQNWVRIRHDPDMIAESDECQDIIRMLSGTDTRVLVERAYPSSRSSAGNHAPQREQL